jgi:protein NrfD
MPSNVFTQPPHWHWLIILYFFLGGLAGGSYFIAALMDLFGDVRDRPLARVGYYVAFPAVVVSGILLTVDLGRPERFWHMLWQSERFAPMFKAWSPMSIGSWALLIFGGFAFLAFLGSLAETGRLGDYRLAWLRPPTATGTILHALGGIVGFFVASYTGVLLTVTNRPIWSDTPLLGLLFLVSAASISAAFMALLGRWSAPWAPGLAALRRFDSWVLIVELLVLVALVVSLGGVVRVWLGAWGLLLLVGVFLIGILLPLALHWRGRALGTLSAPLASVLVLVGGFVLRIVIVLSSEAV